MDAAASGPESAPPADGFEEVRTRLLPALLAAAAFDGWTGTALDKAAREAGVSGAELAAAFPGGVADALRWWSMTADAAMTAAMAAPDFAGLKIREKVAGAVKARIAALRPHKEAARRAAASLALPIHGALGAELAWKSADAVWRGLNDRSTDINFYTKRAILSGVLVSTLARWLADDSEEEAATEAFLAARIENVMQIEKAKAKLRELNVDPGRAIDWLARMRYRAPQDAAQNDTAKKDAGPKDDEQWTEAEVDETLDESFPASDPPGWTPGTA